MTTVFVVRPFGKKRVPISATRSVEVDFNAIHQALGIELMHMPIRAEDVWRAMHEKEPIDNWITKSPAGHCRSVKVE